MTNEKLERANEIKKLISKLSAIHSATFKPYLRFNPLKRSRNGLAIQDGQSVSICDEGLNEVIRGYCDKRIKELNAELEAL